MSGQLHTGSGGDRARVARRDERIEALETVLRTITENMECRLYAESCEPPHTYDYYDENHCHITGICLGCLARTALTQEMTNE